MQGGRRVQPSPPLSEIRDRAAPNFKQPPPQLKRLDVHGEYPVQISDGPHELARQVDVREQAQQSV